MNRTFLTGVLVMAAAIPGLMAEMKCKSKAELEAVQALGTAQSQGPDAIIQAAEALIEKFADTQFKEAALLLEAKAYQDKSDFASAEVTNQRVLDGNPKNPAAAKQMGESISQSVGENDLNKDERLSKAEKYLTQALANVDNNPNTGISDADWAANKKFAQAEVQNDLGLVAIKRKSFDAAVADFKLAVDADPQPAYQVRLALAYQKTGKNDEALAICDKLLADPQLHPAIRKVAQALQTVATQAKGAGGK